MPRTFSIPLLAALLLPFLLVSTPRAHALERRPLHAFNVMAPLVVGDPLAPRGRASALAWASFESTLRQARALGADAVSVDVWWGLVEREDERFDWRYYERVRDTVARVGLRWIPILSFHQCGGNVGDDCDVPLPSWLAAKYAFLDPADPEAAPFYRSEQGNLGRETLSVWATPSVRAEYASFMRAFQAHFAQDRDSIAQLQIGLGPAGELRYPSYNSHDTGAGYPTRGALQAYSGPAVRSFREFALERHGSLAAVARAWGRPLATVEAIRPPSDGETFFRREVPHTAYAQDFFDWYASSLLRHGELVMAQALDVFSSPGAPFRGVPLGIKVAGVHWRAGTDRAAELSAGMLRARDSASWSRADGAAGYEHLLDWLTGLGARAGDTPLVLHFTCLEMSDGAGGPEVASRAKSLVFQIGRAARERGLRIEGENALSWTLHGEEAWRNIEDALREAGYSGITVLRVGDLLRSPTARGHFQRLARRWE